MSSTTILIHSLLLGTHCFILSDFPPENDHSTRDTKTLCGYSESSRPHHNWLRATLMDGRSKGVEEWISRSRAYDPGASIHEGFDESTSQGTYTGVIFKAMTEASSRWKRLVGMFGLVLLASDHYSQPKRTTKSQRQYSTPQRAHRPYIRPSKRCYCQRLSHGVPASFLARQVRLLQQPILGQQSFRQRINGSNIN